MSAKKRLSDKQPNFNEGFRVEATLIAGRLPALPANMKIPLSAPDISDTEINAVIEVLRSPRLSLGPKLEEFERSFAEYAGTKYAVAVSSGTSGLHLCVRALGLKAGDEVITTPFSFIASANVLLYEKAVPVFVDIDLKTLNIDANKIEAAITAKTRAIMVVHVFGRPSPMREIMEIADRYNLKVIEDACEAIGAEYENRRTGSTGDAGVFAFYPNKQITTGEGGMIVSNSDSVAEQARMLRNQGRDASSDWFEHTTLGYNYRLSDINCAVGIEQLKRLEIILIQRESAARKYQARLENNPHLVLPEIDFPNGRISWFVYVVRLKENFTRARRDSIVSEMNEAGIGCGRYFAPIHLQPFYVKTFGFRAGDFPVAEHAAERVVALPFFNRITDAQINEVCKMLEKLCGAN
ncbi:MAG TPA: DegT/DnrJ/EryC1/StrS family aminotransferase [Pyrinomonadaceae bacterium]|nr:DegT/DnrJ/EryC1/StrS family aminotransferase [Pyrinomonadaceae bacterium]